MFSFMFSSSFATLFLIVALFTAAITRAAGRKWQLLAVAVISVVSGTAYVIGAVVFFVGEFDQNIDLVNVGRVLVCIALGFTPQLLWEIFGDPDADAPRLDTSTLDAPRRGTDASPDIDDMFHDLPTGVTRTFATQEIGDLCLDLWERRSLGADTPRSSTSSRSRDITIARGKVDDLPRRVTGAFATQEIGDLCPDLWERRSLGTDAPRLLTSRPGTSSRGCDITVARGRVDDLPKGVTGAFATQEIDDLCLDLWERRSLGADTPRSGTSSRGRDITVARGRVDDLSRGVTGAFATQEIGDLCPDLWERRSLGTDAPRLRTPPLGTSSRGRDITVARGRVDDLPKGVTGAFATQEIGDLCPDLWERRSLGADRPRLRTPPPGTSSRDRDITVARGRVDNLPIVHGRERHDTFNDLSRGVTWGAVEYRAGRTDDDIETHRRRHREPDARSSYDGLHDLFRRFKVAGAKIPREAVVSMKDAKKTLKKKIRRSKRKSLFSCICWSCLGF